MEGRLEPEDPMRLRISDGDRHRMAEFLREAAGEGRIDLEELDERLEATYAAKLYADLVPLVADLPGNGAAAPGIPTGLPAQRPASYPAYAGDAPHHSNSLAVMSGQDRKGVWVVGPSHTAFTLMGGITLDLREAIFASPEVVITANAVMGGIDVIVNPRTRVLVEGVGIMGGFEESRPKAEAELDAQSPLVRVRGVALMAGVTVTRKPMPGERRKRLRRAPS